MARSSVIPTNSSYSPPEDSLSQDINATVERTMKKYSDNMMRFLEGTRLSQLELYCYNLDKMLVNFALNFDVHRSVQFLETTQKELARLQLVQKDSSSSSHGEERVATLVPEPKKSDNTSEAHNNQLALALPHQIAPQQQAPQQTINLKENSVSIAERC